MMFKKKYIIHPGVDEITGKFKTGKQLIKLYGIPQTECIIDNAYFLPEAEHPKFIHLYPRKLQE